MFTSMALGKIGRCGRDVALGKVDVDDSRRGVGEGMW